MGDHNNGEQLQNWAKRRISKSYKITPVQKQRSHDLLKQSKITLSVEIVMEQDKLIFHPQAAAPPIFRVKTNPSTFICQEIHYKFDRYTKDTAGYLFLCNPHSGLSNVSITNKILLLFNLFLPYPLQIKQPIKVDQHKISTPKKEYKILSHTMIVSQSISQICSIMCSIKLSNVKSSQPIFKSSPHNCKYFHKFAHCKYEPVPYTLN